MKDSHARIYSRFSVFIVEFIDPDYGKERTFWHLKRRIDSFMKVDILGRSVAHGAWKGLWWSTAITMNSRVNITRNRSPQLCQKLKDYPSIEPYDIKKKGLWIVRSRLNTHTRTLKWIRNLCIGPAKGRAPIHAATALASSPSKSSKKILKKKKKQNLRDGITCNIKIRINRMLRSFTT